jgi:hypothetical protein
MRLAVADRPLKAPKVSGTDRGEMWLAPIGGEMWLAPIADRLGGS